MRHYEGGRMITVMSPRKSGSKLAKTSLYKGLLFIWRCLEDPTFTWMIFKLWLNYLRNVGTYTHPAHALSWMNCRFQCTWRTYIRWWSEVNHIQGRLGRLYHNYTPLWSRTTEVPRETTPILATVRSPRLLPVPRTIRVWACRVPIKRPGELPGHSKMVRYFVSY